MNIKFQKIKKLQQEQYKTAQKINVAALETFPIGSEVIFYKGNGEVCAEILKFSNGTSSYPPRFYVRSHTGKEYWVDMYWLMQDKPY